MTIKRALVVDDSRSAQVALKKLLEQHELEVDLADSGEAALDYLKKQLVDVIFMDHTMPGMDGLEAVSAIKANPRTATIPVMMYTTKEGEVYVGQARALGAVGVLPKNVQPHQLFEMLQKLDLVKDRRAPREAALVDTDADDEQMVGFSVEALVTRILEDQHMTLRSDILRSQKEFAKAVAAEILHDHERELVEEELEQAEAPQPVKTANHRVWAMAASVLVVVASFLAWQFKSDRDVLLAQVQTLESERVQAELSAENGFDVSARLQRLEAENAELRRETVKALLADINQETQHGLDEDAFNETLAFKVGQLLERLREIEFKGELRLTSHLGEFCMQADETGRLTIADPSIPAQECEVGHPLAGSSYVSDRLSVPFAQLLHSADLGEIEFNLIALDLNSSKIATDYPDPTATAADWNEAALRNNRVEIEIVN